MGRSFVAFIGLISLILSFFPQLSFVPLPSTVRPVAPIFLFIAIAFYFINVRRVFIDRDWLYFFVFVFCYCIFSYLVGKVELYEFVKLMVSIFFAYIVWFSSVNYYFLGRKNCFLVLKFIFYFFFFVFFLEFIGLYILDPVIVFLDIVRSSILTYNVGSGRMRLLFSEPSFMASFLLFVFYMSSINFYSARMNAFMKGFVVVAAFCSASLSVIFAVLVLFVFLYGGTIKLSLRSVVVLAFFGIVSFVLFYDQLGRIQSIGKDQSAFIRNTHAQVLLDMAGACYYLGCGPGGFHSAFFDAIKDVPFVDSIEELKPVLNNEVRATPYSMLLSIFAYFGAVGVYLFMRLFGFFKKGALDSSRKLAFYASIFLSSYLSLPWGLPFAWMLLGFIKSEENESN